MQFPMASMPPMQFAPPQQFAPPPFAYPGTAYQPTPQRPQASPLAPKFVAQPAQQSVLAAQAGETQQKAQPARPQQIIRMQAPDPERSPPSSALVMPSPEELGLALPVVAA